MHRENRSGIASIKPGVVLALILCAGCQAEPEGRIDQTPRRAAPGPGALQAEVPWTRFGGPHQNFRTSDHGLATQWPSAGPRRVWERQLGPGYSGIVVQGNRAYTMYRDDPDEVVICLDAASGATVWEHRYRSPLHARHDPDYGDGPNSMPLLTDGRLYTISVAGVLRCLEADTGKLLWSHDLWGELGGTVLELGYSSSAIPYKSTIIALVGGSGRGAVAFDEKDGRVVWQNLSFENSYSTPTVMNLLGEDQLVAFMATEIVGADPSTGELKWVYSIRNQYPQNICLPLQIDDDLVFISTLEAGSRGLRPGKRDNTYQVDEIWSTRRFQCFYGSFVQLGDHVYGSSGYSTAPLVTAINARTGELAWRKRGFALANVVAAGSRLVILDDEGTLALATPGPEGLVVHAEAQVLTAPARTPPSIVGNVVYARDQVSIVALDLGVAGASVR